MRFSFDQAVRNFHQRLAFAASRWSTGMYAPEDVYQEVLIALCCADFPERRTFCTHTARWVNYDPAYINRFIDSRAKDLVRKENYRQSVKKASLARLALKAASDTDIDLGIDLRDALASLPKVERDVVMLLAAPDNRIAPRLRRNGATMDQVGEVLGMSKASVSRIASRARTALTAKFETSLKARW